jgi:hypothetical protein
MLMLAASQPSKGLRRGKRQLVQRLVQVSQGRLGVRGQPQSRASGLQHSLDHARALGTAWHGEESCQVPRAS